MGQQDIGEKYLESDNEVFADIVNGLLFAGRPVVLPEDLQDHATTTMYKADGGLHQQERDIAKLWARGGAVLSLIGLENQTEVDQDMPLRVLGYDGAAYRSQLLGKKSERYPVLTLVLYFGAERWKTPRALFDRVPVVDELRPYVADYPLNLFEIAWLSNEQVAKFKSDFRTVAEFFIRSRLDGDYQFTPQVIKNVDAVLKMLEALTRDKRIEETGIFSETTPTRRLPCRPF